MAGGLNQLAAVHFDVAEVNVPGQAGGDVVHQHMAEAGVQLGALEDEDAVLGGQLGIVNVEIELAMLGEHDAVDGEAALAEDVNPFEVLFDGGAGIVGRHGVAVQVEVGGQGLSSRRSSRHGRQRTIILRRGGLAQPGMASESGFTGFWDLQDWRLRAGVGGIGAR